MASENLRPTIKDLLTLIGRLDAKDLENLILIIRRNGTMRPVDRIDFRFCPRVDKLPESQYLILYESNRGES